MFITIGTVRQKATATSPKVQWDAAQKQYVNHSLPEYSPIVPLAALDFEEAGYIILPEKRP